MRLNRIVNSQRTHRINCNRIGCEPLLTCAHRYTAILFRVMHTSIRIQLNTLVYVLSYSVNQRMAVSTIFNPYAYLDTQLFVGSIFVLERFNFYDSILEALTHGGALRSRTYFYLDVRILRALPVFSGPMHRFKTV